MLKPTKINEVTKKFISENQEESHIIENLRDELVEMNGLIKTGVTVEQILNFNEKIFDYNKRGIKAGASQGALKMPIKFYLQGNTYHIKEILKEKFGAKWDCCKNAWEVDHSAYVDAQHFVDSSKGELS